jgi:peroxiredoxin-like protein
MENVHYYDVSVVWEKERRGMMSSSILSQNVAVATPPEFPKGMKDIWSPEHLLVAAVNSCIMTTFLAIADNSKLEFSAFESKATGKLEIIEGKFMISEITIIPVLTILKESDKERAERVLQKSDAACLISNSVKSKIVYKPEIKIVTLV